MKTRRELLVYAVVLASLGANAAPLFAQAEEARVLDKNYNVKYRIKDGRVMDSNYNTKGHIKDGKIYDSEYRYRGRIERTEDGSRGSFEPSKPSRTGRTR